MQLTNDHICRGLSILTSVLLLSLGGGMYVLLRPRVILLFRVIDKIGVGSWVDAQRAHFAGSVLPEWVVYCLPNGLWSASYILLMDAIMKHRSLHERLAWACVIPVLGVISELLQGMGMLTGTFDTIDLACYAVPFLIYAALLWIRNRNETQTQSVCNPKCKKS